MTKLRFTLIITLLLSTVALSAQPGRRGGPSKPQSFEEFFRQDTTEMVEGRFNVYKEKDRYFLEIADGSMGREVLIAIQTAQGTAAYVSPASGVYRFEKGEDDKLEIYRSLPTEVAMDNTDLYMFRALERSGLMPSFYQLPIAAFGKDSTSVIVELTEELKNPGGLFAVSDFAQLNRPDANRSGIEGFRMTREGVVFSMKRTQTDRGNNPQTRRQEDRVSSFIVEVTIEELPDRDFEPVKANNAYGFDAVSISEYDSRRFVVRRQNYITKWGLANPRERKARGLKHITVYMDPVIPVEFRECVTRAVTQWNGAFDKAGLGNVLSVSTDMTRASLGYGTILMRWGNAFRELSSSKVVHPVTGEILTARVNLMDAAVEARLMEYLLLCGHADRRITKDIFDMGVRKDILTSMIATELGGVLGLRADYPAFSVYSPKELRNGNFLTKNGMSASVMGELTFNYIVQPGDKVGAAGLMPSVSSYDRDAIAFAYAGRDKGPSEKAASYAPANKLDPYAQAGHLSNDLLGGIRLGVENLKRAYPKLPSIASGANGKDESWLTLAELTKLTLTTYMNYVNKAATLIGGRSVRPVAGKVSATTTVWVDGQRQRDAMAFIEESVLREVPEWLQVDKNLKAADADLDGLFIHNVNGIFNHLLSKDVLASMVRSARDERDAYTIAEMFAFLDRAVFANFDRQASFTPHQTNVQMALVACLVNAALQNNITGGFNDGSAMLHSYLIRTAERVGEFAEGHSDPDIRDSFMLMEQLMRRGYFERPPGSNAPQQQQSRTNALC